MSGTRRQILALIPIVLFSLASVLTSFGTASAQVDSTPSIRAFGLYYIGGTYTDAQAVTMAHRYDMVALDGDGFVNDFYARQVNALRSIKPNSIILIYNSTDLGKINNSKSNSYEWDSLRVYAGGYPHDIFMHYTDSQKMSIGNDTTLPGLNNDPDSSKSEAGWFIGYTNRRHLDFSSAKARSWQIRFNKSGLLHTIPGTSEWADGIWWDNGSVDISQSVRSTDVPFSGIAELSGLRWIYGQAWAPSAEFPNDDTTGTRLRWEFLMEMLREHYDTLKNSVNWHPQGKRQSHAINYAEVRFDLDWGPYNWRTKMYDSNYTKYAYMEHTPNALKPAVFLSPGASNSSTSISTNFWGAKGPISYFDHDVIAQEQGVCVIYHPGFPYSTTYKPYGVANRLYSDLALYYVIRTDSTYWKIHGYNAQTNVGGGTGIAPGTSDSVLWVGAYAYDFSSGFPVDSTPYAYASSVPCTDCDSRLSQANLGKDGVGQNWVVFRRNMPNGNMAMHRAVPGNGTATGNTTYTPDIPLGGEYYKLQIDGTLGPIITTDKFRNGEGGVYVFAGSINNTAPTTPAPSSPTGGVTVPSSPTLTTGASTDPENSSLTYTFQVSKFQNFSSVAVSGNVTSSSTTTVTWQVTPQLEGETSYWWRVKAADFIASSAWSSAQAFLTDTVANAAPTIPVATSPPNGATVAQTSPTLVISASSDVDGDVLSYDFEIYTGGASPVSSTSGVSASGGSAQWAVPLTFADNTDCQWRARAFDGALYSSWSNSQSFTISTTEGNTAPTLPIHASPSVGETFVGPTFTFTWNNSFDPDGDQLGYDIWITSDSSGGVDLDSVRNIQEVSGSSTTSKTLSTALTDGQTYWWCIRVNDAQVWSQRTVPWSFVYDDLSTGAEVGQAEAIFPPLGAVVRTTHPTLVSVNINQAGSNNYYFEVASDSSFVTTVDVSSPVPEGAGDETSWTTVARLNPGSVYYWRVKANDFSYSLVSSFSVALSPHASPSPFRPASDAFTTFHDIPEGATLLLLTMEGEMVRRWYNVVGGTVAWDGTNATGQSTVSGVYLWYIEGSDLRGKLMVQR
ncbi:hypothetical protein JYT16_01615 [Gemmatimonas aurantiaca]|nr:hypothetical protein [Gemmatimonas aurantiaca]